MIIFCFLTYNDIVPLKYWNIFFENIDSNKYEVWIHPKYSINSIKYKFPIKIIKNKINTVEKSDISIVKATIQLFKESFENTKGTHFIFCSQNCIPLYNFQFYENFLSNLNKSIISCIDDNLKNRYYDLDEKIKKFITYNQFVKQQPNMILIRKDIYHLINNDLTSYFRNIQCPDEHYFINLLLYILKIDIIKSQTHFCNFNLNKTQALEFKNPNETLLNSVRNKGFLFMRKIL